MQGARQRAGICVDNNQYSSYYSSRAFYRYDKDYAAKASDVLFVKLQNPLPANSKGATIGPAKTSTTPASPNNGTK